ncbi:MAG: site-specific integrase, partial [Fimbriiglobus sp.]|nr:site-specific integrase [Fimbriiglobus sp.]
TARLPDGRTVGASLKLRGDVYCVQFPHPTEKGKYVEKSTGCTRITDAQNEGSQIVLRCYSPTIAPDPKTATWEIVMADLEADTGLRERSLEAYTSILNVFRRYVPLSKGPGDVTVEIAKAFAAKYARDGFKRGHASDAKAYPRSAKTVENAIRKLSALWNKLMPKYVTSNPWEHVTRPKLPKTLPSVPSEDEVTAFFAWLERRHPGWLLPRLFVELKALAGCRLNDLCQLRSYQFDPKAHTIRITPSQDKTGRERVIPLPPDLSALLDTAKGPTYLWERYLEESKRHRPAKITKKRTDFTPALMYHGMQNIFREYAEQGGKLRSHGLRKRAITLMAMATQNVDQTAEAIGIDAQTARKYYLDAKQAFDGSELFKKMATVLRPQNGPQKSDPDSK